MRFMLPCGCLQKDEDDEDQAHLHKPRGELVPASLGRPVYFCIKSNLNQINNFNLIVIQITSYTNKN